MINGILLFLGTFTVALTAAPTCTELMEDAGLNVYFGEAVAHRTHSLTLEDLRYYFEEDAPVENNIPTVNFDLSANAERVLPHAPLNGYDTSFKTIAMRHADKVLSKMDHKNWGIKNYNVLEMLVHAIHMAELWEGAQAHYKKLMELPPSAEVCSCVRNVEENGVMAELQLLALKIKFPGLTSGNTNLPYGKKAKSSRAYNISYTLEFDSQLTDEASIQKKRQSVNKLKDFNFEGEEDDVVDHAMKELQDGDKGLSEHLTGEKEWNSWKEGFKKMNEVDNFQFAVFVFCMLNE